MHFLHASRLVALVSFWLPVAAALSSGGVALAQEGAAAAATSAEAAQLVSATAENTPPLSSSTRATVLPEEAQIAPSVFSERPIENVTPFNFIAYLVQTAARAGLPSETIAFVLLMPVVATLIAFVRAIVGLPSLGMLVIIAFAIALLASSLVTGLVLLSLIIVGSVTARILLKRVRMIQLPKTALSMFLVVSLLLTGMTLLSRWGFMSFQDISIVPILLLVMLSERITRLQFEVTFKKALRVAAVSLVLGIAAYLLLESAAVRRFVLVYPEVILLVVPLDILMGRYFGLQLVEYFRFKYLDEE